MRLPSSITLLLLAGCATAPLAAVPDPLPETLEWVVPPPAGGAFLGVETRENTSETLDALEFDAGVRVVEVLRGSPAAAAGLVAGDVLLSLMGARTDHPAELAALLAEAPTGETGEPVELRVRRGDSEFRVELELAPLGGAAVAPPERAQRVDPARSRAAWLTGAGGVALVASDPRGPLARAGVPVGALVTDLDGEAVRSDAALVRRLLEREPGERVRMRYRTPQGEEREARVELFEPGRRLTRFSLPILLGYEADPAGEQVSFVLVDLWLISLLRYTRRGQEREWRFLRFFRYATGEGELSG